MINVNELIEKYKIDNYENFHKHTSYSNVVSPDSAALPEDYVKRIIELNQKTLCSTEHGSLISWVYYYDLAKKNNLKYIHSVEAYIVDDRFEKDGSNYHIVLIARTEDGRKQINDITSSSWEDGFYSKPRIDISLLKKLKDKDIMITTACLGGFLKQESMNIFNYIKDNFQYFFLEIQANHTEKQIEHNKKCIQLSHEHRIPLIAGCDSHYIYPENFDDREQYLKSKGIHYDDEEGWYMDFPSVETLIERFIDQGIDERSIANAILNTKIILKFDDISFTKDVKVPTLFPELSILERYDKLSKVVYERLDKYVKDNNLDYAAYKKEIDYEMKAVKDTNMADYFLIAYKTVKLGEEKGGVLTASGRGSACSWITNMLLGLSTIDRLRETIPLFPDRFITAERINESKAIPDIDLNCSNPIPFIEAQKELLGNNSSFYMCAIGKLKEKAAFKMYARAKDLSFDLSNQIVKMLDKYELEVDSWEKHDRVEEEEECPIDIHDYIKDDNHIKILKDSARYLNIVNAFSRSPCAVIAYDKNIREEIGLSRAKSGDMVCNIDGKMADEYKFLKMDWLTVSVVDLIDKVFKKAGVPNWKEVMPTGKLKELSIGDEGIWNIYSNGATLGVNQFEQGASRKINLTYKPQSLEELTKATAVIRPGAKSIQKYFFGRKKYEFGIPMLDKKLQGNHSDSSFMMFQEQAMECLAMSGIPMKDTYDIIKAISKKKIDVINSYKEQFINGMTKRLLEENTEE